MTETSIVVEAEPTVIEVSVAGVAGPRGAVGPQGVQGERGQSAVQPVLVTSSRALSAGDYVSAVTALGPFTLTLPASPSPGDAVRVRGGGWATNNLTIARNGQTILGLAEDLLCNYDDDLTFLFVGGTWSY